MKLDALHADALEDVLEWLPVDDLLPLRLVAQAFCRGVGGVLRHLARRNKLAVPLDAHGGVPARRAFKLCVVACAGGATALVADGIGDHVVIDSLRRSPQLQALTARYADANVIVPAAVASTPHLRELHLQCSPPLARTALDALRGLRHLQSLTLGEVRELHLPTWRAIVAHELTCLARLTIAAARWLTDEILMALAAAPCLRALSLKDLPAGLSPGAFAELAPRTLEELALEDCRELPPDAVAALQSCRALRKLTLKNVGVAYPGRVAAALHAHPTLLRGPVVEEAVVIDGYAPGPELRDALMAAQSLKGSAGDDLT